MSYFQVLDYEKNNLENLQPAGVKKPPFVDFSTNQDRASLMTTGFMPAKSRRRRASSKSSKRRSTKVRIIKGRVALRVGKHLEKITASQLVRFIPLNKLKTAAKKALRVSHKRHKSRVSKRRRTRGRKRFNRRRKGQSQRKSLN